MRKRPAWLQKGILLITTLLFLALSLPAAVFAAPPEGKGPPDGKGGGGGGDDTRKGDLFSEPMIVVRDLGPSPGLDASGNPLPGGNGQPVYFTWYWENSDVDEHGDPLIENGDLPSRWEITDSGCIQPISLEPLYEGQAPYWDTVYPYLDSYGIPDYAVYLIPLNAECEIPEAYPTWGEQVEEIDSGRLNMARTTQSVIDAAYAEAIATIKTAEAISLDAAGRLVLKISETVDGVEVVRFKTIDSPRENLALYQKLMQKGCLSDLVEAEALFLGPLAPLVVCGDPIEDDLLRAASFFAGAADKFGHVGIDEVIYVNTMLSINTVETLTDGWLITGYKDMGDFTYSRDGVHGLTTARLLQPTDTDGITFEIVEGVSIRDKVFLGPWEYIEETAGGPPSYPLMNFVRATDDALSIIYYIHNFEPPVANVPPVP